VDGEKRKNGSFHDREVHIRNLNRFAVLVVLSALCCLLDNPRQPTYLHNYAIHFNNFLLYMYSMINYSRRARVNNIIIQHTSIFPQACVSVLETSF
jgi:hypothetical protein